jgi:hypothetical protein
MKKLTLFAAALLLRQLADMRHLKAAAILAMLEERPNSHQAIK